MLVQWDQKENTEGYCILCTCLFDHFLSTSLAFFKVTDISHEPLGIGDTSVIAHMNKGKVNDMKNVIMQEYLDTSFDLNWVKPV